MELKGKKLLVLTGCNGANDIIEYAKEKGVVTIATDYYEKSKIKDLADFQYNISTTDIEGLYELAKMHNVDGITTGTSEASMYTIMELCKRLGLPFYTSAEQLDTINNKSKFKTLLKKFDVPVPEEFDYSFNDHDKSVNRIVFPVIVKPVDSSGAKGISICKNATELQNAYQFALKFSRSKKVIIEKYLEGLSEVFFNYTIIDGEFSLSCAFDIERRKYYEVGLVGLPVTYLFPSKYLNAFVENVHTKLVVALKSIGIQNGTMSIQCFVDNKSFYIYEAGYRLGGAQMYIFTKELSGISVMEMMVNYSLTGKMTNQLNILEKDNPYFDKFCCQLNIPVNPGIISIMEGVDQIRSVVGVLNVTEVHKQGDKISIDGSIGQLALRIHLVASTKVALSNIIKDIYSKLTILDEEGNDMLIERINL